MVRGLLVGLLRGIRSSLVKMSEVVTVAPVSGSGVGTVTQSGNGAAPLAPCGQDDLKRTIEETVNTDEAKKPKLDEQIDFKTKKRKVAILLAYSGQGYFGMQRNPGTHTIEEDFLSAMFRCGLIPEEGWKQPQQLQFQRAARTDKNVSAARQVVSLKMPAEGPILEKINSELPAQIRALGLCRVTKNFNSKGNCDARTYSYTLPTFSLAPADQTVDETYRAPASVLELTSQTLKLFEGTHNFHNFTSKKHWQDPSANRYIMKFECGEPFVIEDMEFAELRVKGQSFMLHQIRKMVGVAIAIVKGLTGPEVIEKAWLQPRLDIPVAPGLGLVLQEVHYDKYDRKYGGDGMHESLTWPGTQEAVQKFKMDHIMPTILKGEKCDKSMLEWLQTLPLHSYSVRVRPHVSDQKKQDGCEEDQNIEKQESVESQEKELRN